eukprot:gene17666-24014_t
MELPLILILAFTVNMKYHGGDHQLKISVNEVSAVVYRLFLLADAVDLGQKEAGEAYAPSGTDPRLSLGHERPSDETMRDGVTSPKALALAATGTAAHERAEEEASKVAGHETEVEQYASSNDRASDSKMSSAMTYNIESLPMGVALKRRVMQAEKERLKAAAALEAEGRMSSDTKAERSFSGYKLTHVSSQDMIVSPQDTSESTPTTSESESSSMENALYSGKGGFVSVCSRVASEESCQETAFARASELITGAIQNFGRHLRSPPLHIEVLTLSHSGGSSGSSGNSDPKSMSSGGMEGNARADIVTHAIYGPPFLSEVGCDPRRVRPEVNAAVAAALRKEIADRMLAETSFQSNHVTQGRGLKGTSNDCGQTKAGADERKTMKMCQTKQGHEK